MIAQMFGDVQERLVSCCGAQMGLAGDWMAVVVGTDAAGATRLLSGIRGEPYGQRSGLANLALDTGIRRGGGEAWPHRQIASSPDESGSSQ